MKLSKMTCILVGALPLLTLTACASMPTANGEVAQAVSNASNAVQADSVEEILTQNVNIPIQYMLLLMAASTFVPNPFQLIGKALTTVVGGISTLKGLFK